jgi:hypothetical protein
MSNSSVTPTSPSWKEQIQTKELRHYEVNEVGVNFLECPEKLIQSFLERVRASRNIRYSQRALNPLSAEISNVYHDNSRIVNVTSGDNVSLKRRIVDEVGALQYRLGETESYQFQVYATRSLLPTNIDLSFVGRPRVEYNHVRWSFWVDEAITPISPPGPNVAMRLRRVEDDTRPDSLRSNGISSLTNQVNTLTQRVQELEDWFSSIGSAPSASMPTCAICGSTTAQTAASGTTHPRSQVGDERAAVLRGGSTGSRGIIKCERT